MTRLLRSCAITIVIFSSLAFTSSAFADDDVAKLRRDLEEIEDQVERFKRFVPPSSMRSERRASIEAKAKASELAARFTEIGKPERLLLANGRPSPLEISRLEVSGRDRYGDLAFFFFRIGLATPLLSLESLELNAEADETVRFKALMAIPYYAGTEPTPPDATRPDLTRALREKLATERLVRDLFLELVSKPKPARFSEAMAVFTKEADSHAVALTAVRLGNELTVEGFVAGAEARAAMTAAISKAPWKVSNMQLPPAGLCRKFSFKARLHNEGQHDDIVVDNGLFDSKASARCEVKPGKRSTPINVRGSSATGITLKLRDVDFSSLFFALNQATDEDFVIDHDVKGRISVNLEKATLEQTLAALKSAGLVTGSPPLRRVSRTESFRPLRDSQFTGEAISFSLQGADLRDVICLYSRITGLEFLLAPGVEAETTVFASNVEWDRVLEGILATAGLDWKLVEDKVLIGRDPNSLKRDSLVNPCKTPAATATNRFSLIKLEQLDGSDFELAGLARVKNQWKAYVYLSSRLLTSLEPGQQLVGGRVDSISATGIVVSTDKSGKVEIPFAPHPEARFVREERKPSPAQRC